MAAIFPLSTSTAADAFKTYEIFKVIQSQGVRRKLCVYSWKASTQSLHWCQCKLYLSTCVSPFFFDYGAEDKLETERLMLKLTNVDLQLLSHWESKCVLGQSLLLHSASTSHLVTFLGRYTSDYGHMYDNRKSSFTFSGYCPAWWEH